MASITLSAHELAQWEEWSEAQDLAVSNGNCGAGGGHASRRGGGSRNQGGDVWGAWRRCITAPGVLRGMRSISLAVVSD